MMVTSSLMGMLQCTAVQQLPCHFHYTPHSVRDQGLLCQTNHLFHVLRLPLNIPITHVSGKKG